MTRAYRHDRTGHRANHLAPVPAPLDSDATRAMRDALRAIARDIPNPAVYAHQAPLWIVEALLGAQLHLNNGKEWLAASEKDAADLRPYGLVGYGTRGLTAFAIEVRRALKADGA